VRQRLFERSERPGAHALRALLAAAGGEAGLLDRDAAAVLEAEALVPQEALARVALARAVAAERSGDRGALRAILSQDGALLLDASRGRERVLARALMQLVVAGYPSAYRAAAGEDARARRRALAWNAVDPPPSPARRSSW
jgi:hypothetical protein